MEIKIDTPKTREFQKIIKEKIQIILTLNDDIEERYQILNTFKSILKNITSHPNEEKFKKLPKTNKKLESRIIKPSGSLDLLKTIGFKEKQDVFELPNDIPEEKLLKIITIIENEIVKEYGEIKEGSKEELSKGKKKQDEIKLSKKKEKELDEKAKEKVKEKIQQDKEKRSKN